MCKFFPDDIEIEDRPPRRVNEPRRTRLSFVRPADRSSPRNSGEVEVYRRPRSNETIVINHPRDSVRYEEPPITLEPIPPAAPNPPHPNAWHVHYPQAYYPNSASTAGGHHSGIYRTGSNPHSHRHSHSLTPSSYNSHDPIVRVIESSPEPRSPTAARHGHHGSRVVTTTSRRNRETRYVVDNESDRDSFQERRQHRRERRSGEDDDRDSWTEEIVPGQVVRRVTGRDGRGRGRSASRVRRRHDP
ncbi:MAG: hypothetical protein Q9160_004959 [Pyrenula sp. 1 TL-2023]